MKVVWIHRSFQLVNASITVGEEFRKMYTKNCFMARDELKRNKKLGPHNNTEKQKIFSGKEICSIVLTLERTAIIQTRRTHDTFQHQDDKEKIPFNRKFRFSIHNH